MDNSTSPTHSHALVAGDDVESAATAPSDVSFETSEHGLDQTVGEAIDRPIGLHFGDQFLLATVVVVACGIGALGFFTH